MKWNRSVLAAAMAGLLLAGCGGGAEDAAEAEECAALLEEARENMAGLSSLRSEMETGLKISFGESKLDYELTAKLASTAEPFCTQFEMTEQTDGNTESYYGFTKEDETGLVMYVNVGGAWAGRHLTDSETAQYDAKGNVDLFLGGMEDCRKNGGESIDGAETIQIEGVLRGDTMAAALGSSTNTLDIMAGIGLGIEDVQAEISEIPVTVWIDGEGYIRRLEMDATEITEFLMQHMGAEGQDIHIDRYPTVMQFHDFNAVEPITVPAEALDAVMIEE